MNTTQTDTMQRIIASNIDFVRERIANAALSAGRKACDVKLMAVTKFRSGAEIEAAYKAGIRLFGENRVQEAAQKYGGAELHLPGASLHMIGTLQRNKVKSILPLVDCIHSIDRIELLEEIVKRSNSVCAESAPDKRPLQLLLEVHTGEESKSGFVSQDDIVRALEYAEEKKLCVCGFMTMAPFTQDRDAVRRSFVQLRKTAQNMQQRFTSFSLNELSMGMSADFEIAVEEGSTLVRIGSRLFQNCDSEKDT